MCLSFEPSDNAIAETEHLREALSKISSTVKGVNGSERDLERDNMSFALQEIRSFLLRESEEIVEKSREALKSIGELRDANRLYEKRLEDALLGRGQMSIHSAEDVGNG